MNVNELLALDDFIILEQIEQQVINKVPDVKFLISECFSDNLTFPSDAEIEKYLNEEKKAMETMRQYAELSNIPWITVPLETYFSSAILDEVAKVTANSRIKTTFEVDLDKSEDMLRTGEVYLSQFGCWCPVRVHENPNSVQRFYIDFQDRQLYPVVHRKYVYFLSGPENRDKFIQDPLKYTMLELSSTPHREFSSNVVITHQSRFF